MTSRLVPKARACCGGLLTKQQCSTLLGAYVLHFQGCDDGGKVCSQRQATSHTAKFGRTKASRAHLCGHHRCSQGQRWPHQPSLQRGTAGDISNLHAMVTVSTGNKQIVSTGTNITTQPANTAAQFFPLRCTAHAACHSLAGLGIQSSWCMLKEVPPR